MAIEKIVVDHSKVATVFVREEQMVFTREQKIVFVQEDFVRVFKEVKPNGS